MKKNVLFFLSILISFTGFGKTAKLPRIAIAGIAIESSTFSPAVTYEKDFRIRTGDEIYRSYPFLSPDSVNRGRAVWIPTLRAGAMPGGIVAREAYESMVTRTLELLKAQLPLDGLFFDIHGAMSVVGLDDPEGDFIVRIRQVVGKKVLISTSMDLHGSVSFRLAQNTDLITCYRMAPHEDALISCKRAVDNLLDRLENGKGKPAFKALVRVPILLPGEKTSTRVEPGKSLYAQIVPIAAQKGVIDAAIWMSYPWADAPRNGAVVMVTGDDKAAVAKGISQLATSFWKVRNQFEFVAPTTYLDECLEKAIKSTRKPFMISDMGDNPTAGGAGDVTWTLTRLLERKEFQQADGPSVIYASIPGAEVAEEALKVGVGGKVEGYVGAKVDARYAPPVKLSGVVTAVRKSDSGADIEAVVKTGSISVIVTKNRKAYHYEKDFTQLNLNPRKTDIVVVKIGYLVPELYDMRGDWLMALTPGGVDQDLLRLEYKHISRPMFPLDKDMKDPSFDIEWIPASDK